MQERGLRVTEDGFHEVLLTGVLHRLADFGEILDAELDSVLVHQVVGAVLARLHEHCHVLRQPGHLLDLAGCLLQAAACAQSLLQGLEPVRNLAVLDPDVPGIGRARSAAAGQKEGGNREDGAHPQRLRQTSLIRIPAWALYRRLALIRLAVSASTWRAFLRRPP